VSALWTAVRRRVLRPARLATELFRGDLRRHIARAELRAMRHRTAWIGKRALIRARNGRRPIVLIGMVEHFGDIVAAEPVARFIRSENPDAYIVWAVNPSYRELIETNPHVDEPYFVDCLTEWIGLRGSDRFDRIIDLHVHGRFCEDCYALLEQPVHRREIHLDNYYNFGCLLEVFCRSAGIPVLTDAPRVYIPAARRARVDGLGLPERFVAIHTTSNQDSRDWMAEKWQVLAERLATERGLQVVEVGLKPTVDAATPQYTSLCGKLSLLETAEVIRRAEVFIGIDSGPAHLANAAGTYGVILLGRYAAFERYMPYSGDYGSGMNADVIQADGPAKSIPVDRVLEAVARKLSRSPDLSAAAR